MGVCVSLLEKPPRDCGIGIPSKIASLTERLNQANLALEEQRAFSPLIAFFHPWRTGKTKRLASSRSLTEEREMVHIQVWGNLMENELRLKRIVVR